MQEIDVMEGVKRFEQIRTSSKQGDIVKSIEYVIEGNDAINGFEGEDVKQLVLNY